MQPRSLTVHDFLVEFPREPYPLQMDVMAKVLTAVKKRRDAVIESPTGTGKSLALLCSTLAYVRSQPDVTCVVYASRTHAQLQQVMREFQSTAYADRMRAVTLSSREGHCLHADVKNRTGVDQVAACRSLLSKRRCHYRNNVSRVGAEDPDIHALLSDLEDIHLTFPLLKERMLCPYYLAHSAHIVNSAQLVLMPYNYVLDPAARHSVKLDWSKTIVVFDEVRQSTAHVATRAGGAGLTRRGPGAQRGGGVRGVQRVCAQAPRRGVGGAPGGTPGQAPLGTGHGVRGEAAE
jgi:regulator of telomere elongation helicase 1